MSLLLRGVSREESPLARSLSRGVSSSEESLARSLLSRGVSPEESPLARSLLSRGVSREESSLARSLSQGSPEESLFCAGRRYVISQCVTCYNTQKCIGTQNLYAGDHDKNSRPAIRLSGHTFPAGRELATSRPPGGRPDRKIWIAK